MRVIRTPRQAHDYTQALALLGAARPRSVLADQGDETHALLDAGAARGAPPILAQRPNMKRRCAVDARLYSKRILVEPAINQLKPVRRIAPRYDRKPANVMAFRCLATLPVWLPLNGDTA